MSYCDCCVTSGLTADAALPLYAELLCLGWLCRSFAVAGFEHTGSTYTHALWILLVDAECCCILV